MHYQNSSGWKFYKLWRQKGDLAREKRGKKIVAEALKSGKLEALKEIKVHIDGYRKAAIDIGISVEKTLDRLLPRWREVEEKLKEMGS